jgi:hypothetical protein
MKPCSHKIKLTEEEERLLNESVFNILSEGLDIVRSRFPNINDLTCQPPEEDQQQPPQELKP